MRGTVDKLLLVVLKVKAQRDRHKKVVLMRRKKDRETKVAYR